MKVQHKIVLVPLAVMVVVSTLSLWVIESYFEKKLQDRFLYELELFARNSLQAIQLADTYYHRESKTPQSLPQQETHREFLQEIQKIAQNFSRSSNSRITFMDASGQVLGESKTTFDQLEYIENHADRKEFQEALQSGIGQAQHLSSVSSEEMIYVAVRSENLSETSNKLLSYPIIARASRSLASVNMVIGELRSNLFFIGLLSIFTVILLGLFASRVLVKAIQKEQTLLERRVKNRTKEISILQTLSGLLNACSTLSEAGQVLRTIIPSLLPHLRGSVAIIKSSRNRLDEICSWGGDWPGQEKFLPADCWALRKGHQHTSKNHDIQIHCNHWKSTDSITRALCIPLLAQGETIGTLHFVTDHQESMENEEALLHAIAEQVGLTLANIQLRDNLREQAIRDPLTDLYNRRYMMEALNQIHSRAEREGHSIAVMMVDLDHFKRFNDKFGHEAGDHVLKSTANIFKEATRNEDIACRYGGEEFCFIFPNTNKAQAVSIAERIHDSIRKLELSLNQLPLGTVTASIGIAMYPEHAVLIEDVLTIADEALYQAKEEGRDRIVVAEATLLEHQGDSVEKSSPEKVQSVSG